jgi:hypothetical protein
MAPKSSTIRTTRRRLHAVGSTDDIAISVTALDEHLAALASMLEERTAGDDHPLILRVTAARRIDDGIDVGLRPIDDLGGSVVDALACFDAPTSWLAIGVATGGNAYRLDERRDARTRVRLVHLVTRSGATASVMRLAGDQPTVVRANEADGPTGRVDDVCRLALGLPTAPPGSTLELWALAWLERIVALGTTEAPRTWDAVAALHPAVETLVESAPELEEEASARLVRLGRLLSEIQDWPSLRIACGAGHWPTEGVTPAAARWLDDGAFSRWVLGSYPPLRRLNGAVRELLAPPIAARVQSVLREWDLDAA